ncbi:MAG: M15 family metallopeptidase [Oscillospiraceae bacterium]|nr:M15 family metallopeptidase [Oscillospiraceae bacterium]
MNNNDREIYDYKKDNVFGEKKKKKRIRWDVVFIFASLVVIIATILIVLKIIDGAEKNDSGSSLATQSQPEETTTTTTVTTTTPTTTTTTTTTVTEPPLPYPVEKDIQIIDGATYINGILVINKTYSVPASFDPGVDPVAYAALEEMYAAASKEGISLWTASGYRTYDYQKNLYENYAARDGYDEADRYSARPGNSEHESGLAFDVNDPSESFHGTPEAIWLEENCAKYGFIIRYPKGKEDITGFMYESWHIRYVGTEIATVIMENGICLEEYFDITSKYPDSIEN